MAVVSPNVPSSILTNASFRTWIAAVRQALLDVGLVRTADTGQVDAATVVLPATNAYAGYDIFRFNDALQATAPFFLKVEYGQGTLAGRIGLAITVGTGTNGAGTLTGQIGARKEIRTNGAPEADGTNRILYACGDGSGAVLVCNSPIQDINQTIGLAIDRFRDSNGLPTGEGVYWCTMSSFDGYGCGVVTPNGVATITQKHSTVNPGALLSKVGADAALGPHIAFAGGVVRGVKHVLTYKAADIALGTFQAQHLSGVHTYRALGAAIATIFSPEATGTPSLAMLYE